MGVSFRVFVDDLRQSGFSEKRNPRALIDTTHRAVLENQLDSVLRMRISDTERLLRPRSIKPPGGLEFLPLVARANTCPDYQARNGQKPGLQLVWCHSLGGCCSRLMRERRASPAADYFARALYKFSFCSIFSSMHNKTLHKTSRIR